MLSNVSRFIHQDGQFLCLNENYINATSNQEFNRFCHTLLRNHSSEEFPQNSINDFQFHKFRWKYISIY